MLLLGGATVLLACWPRGGGHPSGGLALACLRGGWLAVAAMAVLACLGIRLPGGPVAWNGLSASPRVIALLVPLGLAGGAASAWRDLAACAAAGLAVMGNDVLSCAGAGWILLVTGTTRRAGARHAPDMIALLLLAAGLTCPERAGWLLPGLCWCATRGLLGLSFSPRIAPRAGRPFHLADIAGMIAAMGLWGRLPRAGMVADMRWGWLLVVAGCLFYMTASWRALRAGEGRGVMAGLLGGSGALVIVLAGLGLLARADDLPAMAVSASRTSMLVVATLLTWVFMARALDVMERETGALILLRLGGLGMLMPWLSALFAFGLLAESGLPPLLGFSVIWMLLHLLADMSHGGGLAGDMPLLAALVALGVGWAVRMLALVRVVAVMLCGRPRTPRGAGAADPDGRAMIPVLAAGVPVLLSSIWPGLWMGLMEGADHGLSGSLLHPAVNDIVLASPDGTAILHPGRLCLLVAVMGGVALLLRRLACPTPARQVAGWQQGAPAVPPWMVFGDPLTQPGPASPARMVLDMLVPAPTRLRWVRAYVRWRAWAGRGGRVLLHRMDWLWQGRVIAVPAVMLLACLGALVFIAWHG
ncbi:proton-conducting transporter membrane subunit [Komagataeibacter sp. FNDCF1]|uniref:proton-conducting transporter transmembrane domain-containing protein n=1 Tax=Komagataeibacter sp. FNDCF1 TaxID=2878681 RepID=UPI001E55905C|nr:proton-conducting transporter membrane subunit [Komagataeibacter sp. FNDCF1]MCE2564325.1 hypothetical protein [Komagataeibacter sp. FNDCF1]